MPGYKAHAVIAMSAYAVCLVVVSIFWVSHPPCLKALEWFFCAIAGGLFPDVDTKSKGQIIFYELLAGVLFLLWWKQQLAAFVWVTFVAFTPLLVHHRGLFHRPWFVIVCPLGGALLCSAAYRVPSQFLLLDALFFSVGALSHIYADWTMTRIKKMRG